MSNENNFDNSANQNTQCNLNENPTLSETLKVLSELLTDNQEVPKDKVEDLPQVYNFSDWLYYMSLEPDNQDITKQFKSLIEFLEEYVGAMNRQVWVVGVLNIIRDHREELDYDLRLWLETRLCSPKVVIEEYEQEIKLCVDMVWSSAEKMTTQLVARGIPLEKAIECARKYGLEIFEKKKCEYELANPNIVLNF